MRTRESAHASGTRERRTSVLARVELVDAFNCLEEALGGLTVDAGRACALAWDTMPSHAPVSNAAALRREMQRMLDTEPLDDVRAQWQRYLAALAAFADTPCFGPAPALMGEHCVAVVSMTRRTRTYHFTTDVPVTYRGRAKH